MFKISCVLFTAVLLLTSPALAQQRSRPPTQGSYGYAQPPGGHYPGPPPAGRGWGPGWQPGGGAALRFLPLIIPQVTLAVRPLAPPAAPSQIH
jgi:hypothetical protein